ncbi:PAP2-domain-containing protein [Macroventuria anomochaeta]|uniref:PAP2-domain-containing protein n=1 Tax=Macroventuria anomochaeta TaxID=301207 RepID=A0ACB6RJX4_9PLEO|nr:PAP2-domain-containing protein [Macroventuria anomochaeta]KAF2621700.1 PAP2-domain-containing protein [Macroventuria anomochaeta]
MSTAIASPRTALDLHRRSYSPVPSPPPLDGIFDFAPPVPLSTIRVPSLSDILEERTPRTTGSSHSNIKSLEGNASTASDPEAQLIDRPKRRRDVLMPGFRNQPPFIIWLRYCWLGILTQLLCLLVAELIYLFATPLMPRYFPLYPGVWTSAWGMKYGQPYLGEYISTLVSAVVSFTVPLVVMGAIGLWYVRDFWESNAAIMGLGYALATATLFQSFIKWFIGGLRPHFLSICLPSIPQPLPGLGPTVCTGDPHLVREAQMSFPSGHSSAAFAGFGFLALYLNSKLKVIGRKPNTNAVLAEEKEGEEEKAELGRDENGAERKATGTERKATGTERKATGTERKATGTERKDTGTERKYNGAEKERTWKTQHWHFILWVLPWLVALLIAASKIRDGWHHPADVLFGSLVGVLFAHMAYWCVFRGVYDGRVNHLPRD